MEVVQLPGYTQREKIEIGKRFLVPKQLHNHGLTRKNYAITDAAFTELVQAYTHEAGVRNLERELANTMRKVARTVAEGRKKKTVVDVPKLVEYLGRPLRLRGARIRGPGRCRHRVGGHRGRRRHRRRGSDPHGGQGGLHSDRSARRCHEGIRPGRPLLDPANAAVLGIEREAFEKHTLPSMSRPARAQGRPSAGVTMATAMVSALTGIPVRREVA